MCHIQRRPALCVRREWGQKRPQRDYEIFGVREEVMSVWRHANIDGVQKLWCEVLERLIIEDIIMQRRSGRQRQQGATSTGERHLSQ